MRYYDRKFLNIHLLNSRKFLTSTSKLFILKNLMSTFTQNKRGVQLQSTSRERRKRLTTRLVWRWFRRTSYTDLFEVYLDNSRILRENLLYVSINIFCNHILDKSTDISQKSRDVSRFISDNSQNTSGYLEGCLEGCLPTNRGISHNMSRDISKNPENLSKNLRDISQPIEGYLSTSRGISRIKTRGISKNLRDISQQFEG